MNNKYKEYTVRVYDDRTQWHDKDGLLHREDGPAIECTNGDKGYWIHGILHREDGPAIEHVDGRKEYYVNGILHREDGPALITPRGITEYWLHGKAVSKQEFDSRNKSCHGRVVEIAGVKYKLEAI